MKPKESTCIELLKMKPYLFDYRNHYNEEEPQR